MQGGFSEGAVLAAWSFALGVGLCVLWDLFKLVRGGSMNRILMFVCDLVFCVFAACAFSVLFFNLTYGRPRVIAFACAFAGALVWHATVGKLLFSLAQRFLCVLSKAFRSLLHRLKKKAIYFRRERATKRFRRAEIKEIKRLVRKGIITGNGKEKNSPQ